MVNNEFNSRNSKFKLVQFLNCLNEWLLRYPQVIFTSESNYDERKAKFNCSIN